MSKQTVGFAGLGIMGSGMVNNLLQAGFEVHVWNRSRNKADELLAEGAKWADAPAALAEAAETILLCLTNDEAVEDVLFGEQGVMKGGGVRLIVDHSTISPARAEEFAERLASCGTAFIDAPVSGGDVGARKGTLTIMAGGDRQAFDDARELFECIGSKIVHTGPAGSGQRTKCVNQLVVAVTIAAMTEGLVFAKDAGLDVETTLDVIASGAAGSWALDNYAPRILAGRYEPGFYARDMLKDLRIAARQAEDQQTPLPVSALVKELYTALCRGKDAELGNHALIRLYEAFGR